MTNSSTDTDLAAAADPGTPAAELGRIAAERADLHLTLAKNPSTYEALLDWMLQQGDAATQAAIHERRGTAPEPAAEPAAGAAPETPTPAQPKPAPAPRKPMGRGGWLLVGVAIGFVVGAALSAVLVLLVLPGLFGG